MSNNMRTAIVTGGGSGIVETLERTRQLAQGSGLIETHVADVTDDASVEQL
jgi:hypothetical protein